ncbi:MAG: porin [Bradyrhizobium sp.]|uniref:porin n=1 Tax=Bradyrhizobium sp. TaxID=376 RepID=UPI001D9DB579|nr:porin [Bradyrhizobium sp.]MBV9566228.1 porin [Bradyrhizobium sp.]
MKMIKSLVLGSAAVLIAVGGAQAADLPVKAKAVEYVKVCSLYGAGFWYIPGTDTCIKLGGYLRADVVVNANNDAGGNVNGAGGANNRFTNGFTWRARQDLSVDTRTATEYGVVRTFSEFTLSWTDDTYAGNPAAPGSTVYGPIGGGAVAGIAPLLGNVAPGSAPNNANAGAVAGGTLGVYYAYIQFAGFTIGKAISQFSAPWTNYPGNNFDGLVGGGGDVTGVNQFTYTAEFGQGISAAISVQDPTQYYQAGVNNLSAGGLFGASDYAGTIAPDIVGMVRVDQAWGLFQLSAAAHDNHAAYFGSTELTGHPDDKWGFAVQAALQIKNIPTGPGDTINIQGVYTDGATRYNIQDLANQYSAATIYGGSNMAGAYQSVGLGFAPDTVFAAGTQQQLTQTYGMRGAFNHNWDPYWSSSLYGAWASVQYNGTAKGLICNTPGLGFAAAVAAGTVTTCNPDYNIGQLGFITRWTPVKNLTFSGDVTWSHLDQKFAGTLSVPSAAVGKPAAVYQLKDQDTVTLLLRAQRNF